MTDLQKIEDQLNLALKEIKAIKGRNVELLHDYVFEAHRLVENCILPNVNESNLIEELRLKLIGMECFAEEYYNEAAKEGTKTVFTELKNWINKKRKLYSH